MARLFALDQNFPEPIIGALRTYQADSELEPLREIDPRMPTLDDRELLLALHRDPAAWDGLITTDSQMALQAPELVALIETKLSLVVVHGAGHNPVRATGLLFTHLAAICRLTSPNKPQLWILRANSPPPRDPWDELKLVANRQGQTADALLAAHRIAASDPDTE